MRAMVWPLAVVLCAVVTRSVDAAVPQEQVPQLPPRADQLSSPVEAAMFVDYRVGPADTLAISVFGLTDLDLRDVRVSNSGKIHVPFLGVIKVNEMTTSQIAAEIAKGLKDKGILNDPWVQVAVTQYRAHPVYLLGEVWTPGQFLITDKMTILDLLTLGNGTSFHTAIGFLYRRKLKEGGLLPGDDDMIASTEEEAIPVDFEAIMDGRQANLELRGGDVLHVTLRKPELFYVVGAVNRPGVLEFAPRQPILVSQAIAMAGGLERTAKGSKGVLLRYDQTGVRTERRVNMDAILKGKAPDFPVQPDDIIFIPGSAAKDVGYGLLSLVPMVVSNIVIPF